MSRDVRVEIEKLINTNKYLIFMKGSPDFSKCGFCTQALALFRRHGLLYSLAYVDISEDEEMNQAIMSYTGWATTPMIFIDNKFIGGLEGLMDLNRTGELAKIANS